MSTRFGRGILAVLTSLVLALLPRAASAITLASSYPQRSTAGKANTPWVDGQNNAGINRNDCADGETWTFEFNGFPSTGGMSEIRIYASAAGTASCLDKSLREGTASASTKSCWRLSTIPVSNVQSGQKFTISSLQMVAPLLSQTDTDGTSVTTAACYPTGSSTPPTNFLLHFVAVDGLQNGVDETTWANAYDLIGPDAPTGFSVLAGETLITANWTAQTTPASDFFAYRIYCFPNPNHAPPQDAGDAGDAGETGAADATSTDAAADTTTDSGGATDAAGATDSGDDSSDASETITDAATMTPGDVGADSADATSTTASDASTAEAGIFGPATSGRTCPASVPFVASGQVPTLDMDTYYQCASISTFGNQATVTGLTDNQPYAIAISAIDKLGNAGPLTVFDCDTPRKVNDFFTGYTAAGGNAGGGFCAIGDGRSVSFRAYAFGGSMIALATVLRMARRAPKKGGRR